MIEIRLRAAASNPGSRPWRWGMSLAALVLAVVAPVATSRAQDARPAIADVESLKALKVVSIEGGDAIAITSGAASITLKTDGTIVLRGTEIVIDGSSNVKAKAPQTSPSRAAQMSEIF
jgi:hypothetical protein